MTTAQMPSLANSQSHTATCTGPGVVSPSVPGRTPSASTTPSVPMAAAGPWEASRWRASRLDMPLATSVASATITM